MAKIITVSTVQGLYAALAQAKGGETISLAAGDYGSLFSGGKSGASLTFPSTVTITSADPGHPAVFSGMDIKSSANLTLDGLTFDYTFAAGDRTNDRHFTVANSTNITIRNSTFDGDVAKGVNAASDGFGSGIALTVRGSTGVVIEDNEVSNFHRGFSVSDSQNISVKGNDVHDMRMDGMTYSQVKNIVIEDNKIHDFRGSPTSGDHCDMIQFWTNGTTAPSENITIRGNHLDIGDGTFTQSIFMRNEEVDLGRAGKSMYYRNVLIEDNVIVNGHLHGISVGETNGLTIRNNSVLHSDGGDRDGGDPGLEIPRINIATSSTNVSITNNATADIVGWSNQTGWLVKNNAFVQDQDSHAPGYYGNVFISSTLQTVNGLHDFRALEGGMLDTLSAGAVITRDSGDSTMNARFQVMTDATDSATRIFDASVSVGNLATLPKGTLFQWTFGDGTSANGTVVAHAFTDGGTYDVTLTIKQPGGSVSAVKLPVSVQGPEVVSMTAAKGFIAYEAGAEIAIAAPHAMTADGLQLGGKGVAMSIARAHVTDILGADDFNIDLTLKADIKGTSGEVFRMHDTILVSVTAKGELSLRASTTAGEVKLTTTGAALNNSTSHDISIQLYNDKLQVLVDGKVTGSAAMTGTLSADNSQTNLVFGNPWNKTNFTGDLKAFEITTDASDFHTVAQTMILSNPFNSVNTVTAVGRSFHATALSDFAAGSHSAASDGGLMDPSISANMGDRFEFLNHYHADHILM